MSARWAECVGQVALTCHGRGKSPRRSRKARRSKGRRSFFPDWRDKLPLVRDSGTKPEFVTVSVALQKKSFSRRTQSFFMHGEIHHEGHQDHERRCDRVGRENLDRDRGNSGGGICPFGPDAVDLGPPVGEKTLRPSRETSRQRQVLKAFFLRGICEERGDLRKQE